MAEKNIHEVSDAAAAVGEFLRKRRNYAGRERIMAVEGSELRTSDLEKLVNFAHSMKREVGAMKPDGQVGDVPHGDPAWLHDNEKLVQRYATPWREVSIDESAR